MVGANPSGSAVWGFSEVVGQTFLTDVVTVSLETGPELMLIPLPPVPSCCPSPSVRICVPAACKHSCFPVSNTKLKKSKTWLMCISLDGSSAYYMITIPQCCHH